MTAIDNILVLMDTISSFEGHSSSTIHCEDYDDYIGKRRKIHVFLPEDIDKLRNSVPKCQVEVSGNCKITCDNSDTYTMACRVYRELNPMENSDEHLENTENFAAKEGTADSVKCMVLNFANPYHPGGGVRRGANAQEENLCRRSSLLLSLESEEAKSYYTYNKKHSVKDIHWNDYGTNSMMITPFVEVIKDKRYERKEYAEVAVLTSAMPIIRDKQRVSDEYLDLVYQKINSVLLGAACYGYTHLVLGAWGCGAFGNEPEVVAKLFRDAIDNFSYAGKNVHQLFEMISFSVPYSEKKPANYFAFKEQFDN